MEEWGYVVAVVAGVIISEGVRLLRDWRGERHRYSLMLYEKRLEVHQKALYYIERLSDPLYDYFGADVHPDFKKLLAISFLIFLTPKGISEVKSLRKAT